MTPVGVAASAAATGLPDRRLFLATGATLAVLASPHKAAASNADAELIAFCAAILKTDAEIGVLITADQDHPDLDRLFIEWQQGTIDISEVPAKTMAGIKAKASVLATWEPHSSNEKDYLTDSLVADILAL